MVSWTGVGRCTGKGGGCTHKDDISHYHRRHDEGGRRDVGRSFNCEVVCGRRLAVIRVDERVEQPLHSHDPVL